MTCMSADGRGTKSLCAISHKTCARFASLALGASMFAWVVKPVWCDSGSRRGHSQILDYNQAGFFSSGLRYWCAMDSLSISYSQTHLSHFPDAEPSKRLEGFLLVFVRSSEG